MIFVIAELPGLIMQCVVKIRRGKWI